MKTAVISFNKQGETIAGWLGQKVQFDLYSKKADEAFNIAELAGRLMAEYEALIFISSTGIAVRAIAPYIKSKDIDPAVVVIDSLGRFVISLLSGHLGGANELTLKISELLEAQPIITTATDGLGVEAPDIIAKKYGLVIDSLKDAKCIAALLVDGKKVAFIDEEKTIDAPMGYTTDIDGAQGIVYVTNKNNKDCVKENVRTLKLVRQNTILGIGCRKDYSPEKMRLKVLDKLGEYNIDQRAVKAIATIEVKKNEKAIIELAEFLNVELKIFTCKEIEKVQHRYKGSDFVRKTIGVRAVCEPCVELCGGILLTDKLSCEGMTLCIGRKE